MFPIVRFFKEIALAARAPALPAFGAEHVSHHICWPWDLDLFAELNNGRALTLYDLGRLAMAQRAGLIRALRQQSWAMTMAGATVRYRKRITIFERFTMRSRPLCWDDRFLYLEQSMWKRNGDCAGHILYRAAITENGKMIAPSRVAQALGLPPQSPRMPTWVQDWCRAEAARPWPPMQDD
jgi:acyl-CoA thioesterase FadM